MAFPWFRQRRESTAAVSSASDASPAALLHARIRAHIGNPGPHLCRPEHGCGPLAGLEGRRIAAFVFDDGGQHASRLELAPAGGDESYLLMHDVRGIEADVVAFGVLPKAVSDDPWRLWIVLQRLFDANDRLSTPVLPDVPQFVAPGDLLRPDHLRQLCWSALRVLPDHARVGRSDAEFEQVWERITGAEARALYGARIEPAHA
jgi:hypothetical protein